jgi:hypothetical protein
VFGTLGASLKFVFHLKRDPDLLEQEPEPDLLAFLKRFVLRYLWPDLPVAVLSGAAAAISDRAFGSPMSLLVASILAGYSGFDLYEAGEDVIRSLLPRFVSKAAPDNMCSCSVVLSERQLASLSRVGRERRILRGEVVRRAIDAYTLEN